MTPQELSSLLEKNKEALTLLDVREPFEHDICLIPGSLCIPLGQIPERTSEIPTDKPIVSICHHGVRSLRAINFLETKGFSNMHNLDGGIDRYALEADKSLATY